MSTNMDGPDALIQEVLDLPVEDLQTLLVAVIDRLRPLANLVDAASTVAQYVPSQEQLFDVLITACNENRPIQTIKAVRQASGVAGRRAHALKESKDMVDDLRYKRVPGVVAIRLLHEEAEECVRILKSDGATAEIRPHNA